MTRLSLGARDYTLWRFDPEDPSSFHLVETGARIGAAFEAGAGDRAVRLGGLGLAFASLSVSNFWNIVASSAVAMALISLTMFAILRSARLGAVSAAPNIAPILLALGVWCLLHEQINMAAATVFSVSMGLVVDDTIHVLLKYRLNRDDGLAPRAAMERAVRSSGVGLLATTLVIAGGFLLLSLSGFLLTAQKAGLVGATVVLALLFDLTALPAIVALADRDARDGATPDTLKGEAA
jgi:predicted RND superfamily exporter protein